MSAPSLRVLVADDEPLARAAVTAFLGAHADCVVVAETTSGRETAHALRSFQPDLAFLDVEMPAGSGFDAVADHPPPAVVFVTAYAEFAAQAFDVPAVDYLVKPFDRARFDRALDRVRRHLGRSADSPEIPERLAVRTGNRVVLVPVQTLQAVESAGDYARLHTATVTYLHDARLGDLERALSPALVRVHRRWLVAPGRVASVRLLKSGDAVLTLDSDLVVRASRSRRPAWAHLLS